MFAKILDHKITLVVGLILVIGVIGVGGYLSFRPQAQHFDTVPAAIRNIQQSVTADGAIDSDQDVGLSFEKSGTIASVNVKVGDHVAQGQILASLDNSDLQAQLLSAEADVTSAAASASSDKGGSLADDALSSAVSDSYLKSEDAILNKTDAFFSNPTSANPVITIPLDSYSDGLAINSQRINISTALGTWKNDIALASSTGPSQSLLDESSADLSLIQSFIATLTAKTNRLSTGNSGLSQSQIASYVATANAAGTEENAALSEFNAAVQTYRSSAGSLQKAQAEVAVINAQINDGVITAPFAAVVASVNPKAGEAWAAADPAITLVSAGMYKMDVMIPENQVAKIRVGDTAVLTLDASSDLSATATVASIDLAPTVTNGVSTYKTTLCLNGADSRIRVGMTANATILGAIAANVVAVPSSSIISENGDEFVLILNSAGSFSRQKVETGVSDGAYTEIVSGVSAGQNVAEFGNK